MLSPLRRWTKYLANLKFQVRGDKGSKVLMYKSNKLNDGKWHDISMLKEAHEILLKVFSTFILHFMTCTTC